MKIYVGDKIEFKPRYGTPRMVEVTAVGPRGFSAIPTGARHVRVFGYHEQIIRVLQRAEANVEHKTKVIGIGDTFVAWLCRCGHQDMSIDEDCEGAMKKARIQQNRHKNARLASPRIV